MTTLYYEDSNNVLKTVYNIPYSDVFFPLNCLKVVFTVLKVKRFQKFKENFTADFVFKGIKTSREAFT
jgi:hypothetical protein